MATGADLAVLKSKLECAWKNVVGFTKVGQLGRKTFGDSVWETEFGVNAYHIPMSKISVYPKSDPNPGNRDPVYMLGSGCKSITFSGMMIDEFMRSWEETFQCVCDDLVAHRIPCIVETTKEPQLMTTVRVRNIPFRFVACFYDVVGNALVIQSYTLVPAERIPTEKSLP